MPGYARSLGKRKDKSTIWQARWRPPGDPSDRGRIEKVVQDASPRGRLAEEDGHGRLRRAGHRPPAG